MIDKLNHAAKQLGIELDAQAANKLINYLDALALWNKAYNLTAITRPDDMLTKHIVDSLSVLPHLLSINPKGRLLDVGTGAGLPGLVIAIMQPMRKIALLDSNSKKVRFLRQVVSELDLPNVTPVHARIEEANLGEFEVITSRAFSSLVDFVNLTQDYLAEGGVLFAMKGVVPEGEMQALQEKWSMQTHGLTVPNLNEARSLVVLNQR